jgi:hypothetical protein
MEYSSSRETARFFYLGKTSCALFARYGFHVNTSDMSDDYQGGGAIGHGGFS